MHLLDGVGQNNVARGIARDVERLQDGNAAGDQSAERATETRNGAFFDQVPEERHAQLDRVNDGQPLFGAAGQIVDHNDNDQRTQDHIPLVLEETAGADDELGERGQWFATEHVGKDLLELGHNVDEQEGHDGDRDDQHDDRVEHGGDDFVLQLLRLFLEVGQTDEDELHDAAKFAGFHHVDIKLVENFRMLSEAIGKSAASLHGVGQLSDRLAQHRVGFLLAEHIETTQQRET